jgi:glutathione synthase/RimK-type ligase-like ATP-grasp enzyme
MRNLKVLPYKMNSLSSKAISRHFKCKRIYPNRNYIPRTGHVVLNWGYAGDAPALRRGNADIIIINRPENVALASNKIKTLINLELSDVPHVTFYLKKKDAAKAIRNGKIIYCRTLVSSKEGKGIVLATTEDELVDAKLYTEYFENDAEYRIHVFNGEVIDAVQKKKMSSSRRAEKNIVITEESKYIRNFKKGWSFCRKGIEVPDIVKEVALAAIPALGLVFGAVDIAYNSNTGEARVLEINTAPGMKRGTTTHLRYVRAISKYLGIAFSVDEYNKRYNSNAENYLEEEDSDD